MCSAWSRSLMHIRFRSFARVVDVSHFVHQYSSIFINISFINIYFFALVRYFCTSPMRRLKIRPVSRLSLISCTHRFWSGELLCTLSMSPTYRRSLYECLSCTGCPKRRAPRTQHPARRKRRSLTLAMSTTRISPRWGGRHAPLFRTPSAPSTVVFLLQGSVDCAAALIQI